jgi:hypothetical protein
VATAEPPSSASCTLIKLAATIVEKKTRIVVTLLVSCPEQRLLRLLFDALAPPSPA